MFGQRQRKKLLNLFNSLWSITYTESQVDDFVFLEVSVDIQYLRSACN